MADTGSIRQRYELMAPLLDERARRLVAAAEAIALGRGGISRVCEATGLSRCAIADGVKELRNPELCVQGRIRRPGAGRKSLVENDPSLLSDLEGLVSPTTRGDPESPLRWTCKSVRVLAAELARTSHSVCPKSVATLLHEQGYSLQANSKTLEGGTHEDRNAQFTHINSRVKGWLADGQPAISVDTKKKELVGDFKNGGQEWRPKGIPDKVRVHDFVVPELGKASPYGVYDLAHDLGWVNVGVDHDTSAFAVASIRRWWEAMGRPLYPGAERLLITADGGGSNGSRVRLWKVELQGLADQTGLQISVCHLPPGTSKWNKMPLRYLVWVAGSRKSSLPAIR